jgi:hypothetical protein
MESDITILDPIRFKNNPKAKLVRHPEDKGNSLLEQLTAMSENATNFLDLNVQTPSGSGDWRFTRTINVTTEGMNEVPFYQREYWMTRVKSTVEHVANQSPVDPSSSPWRIIDICSPSLITRELLKDDGFTTYLTRTFRAVDSGLFDRIVKGRAKDRVKIINPDVLGRVLRFTKEYYLRHQFYKPGVDTYITLKEIKEEKVFFATVKSGGGPRESFIVKFDHPSMIDRERLHYEEIRKALEPYKRSYLSSCVYHLGDIKRTGFVDKDLLDIVVSQAIAPELPPSSLTLKAIWPPKGNSEMRSISKSLEPLFDLLEELAVSYPRTRFKATSITRFYTSFFRRLNGFTVSRKYEDLQSLLPKLYSNAKGRAVTNYSIRRVRIHRDDASQDLHLSIQLEPDIGERLMISFKQFSGESHWLRTLALSQLLNQTKLALDPAMFTVKENVWSRAIEKLTSKLEDSHISWGGYLTDHHLPFSSTAKPLPNPIRFYDSVQSKRRFPLKGKRFHWISSLIHFDLHPDNILPPVSVRGRTLKKTPTLIDVASMEEGPIEYDYARMEARLVLDGRNAKWLQQDLASEIDSIVKFNEAIKGRGLAARSDEFKMEVDFIRRLRRRRAKTVQKIQEERFKDLKGSVYEEAEDTLTICLFFEYLSEFFERSSRSPDTRLDLLWAFISAAYYLRDLEESSS